VSTILQSGNVFHSGAPESAAAAVVAAAIEDAFALQVGVVVRSAGDLAVVASQNPFLAEHAGLDPSTLHVAFLAERPAGAAVATLEADRSPPDACAWGRWTGRPGYSPASAATSSSSGRRSCGRVCAGSQTA
jgi:uncharacterized protein (DUF1697 family)